MKKLILIAYLVTWFVEREDCPQIRADVQQFDDYGRRLSGGKKGQSIIPKEKKFKELLEAHQFAIKAPQGRNEMGDSVTGFVIEKIDE